MNEVFKIVDDLHTFVSNIGFRSFEKGWIINGFFDEGRPKTFSIEDTPKRRVEFLILLLDKETGHKGLILYQIFRSGQFHRKINQKISEVLNRNMRNKKSFLGYLPTSETSRVFSRSFWNLSEDEANNFEKELGLGEKSAEEIFEIINKLN